MLMLAWITSILGKYTYNTFSLVLFFWQCASILIFMMRKHEKYKYFLLRVIGCLVLGTLICYGTAIVNTEITEGAYLITRLLCYNTVSCLTIGMVLICYKAKISEKLLCWCASLAIYQFIGKFFPLVQQLAGIDETTTISFIHSGTPLWYDWILYAIFHVGGYLLLLKVFSRKDFLSENIQTTANLVCVSLVTTIFVNGVICAARPFEKESEALTLIVKIFSIVFSLGILIICSNIFAENKSKEELRIIKSLLNQEKQQYRNIKANMDFINMKCHDLKHVLHKFENKLDVSEIEELKQAIEFYDNSYQTGNDIVDMLLCEKNYECQKQEIKLSCMADCSRLNVLSNSKIYSLFTNILNNAIEALKKVDNPEKKIISLTVNNTDEGVAIEESNYLSSPLQFTGNLPLSTNDDKNKHGYGIKSIKYLVEQYGGNVQIFTTNNIYRIRVFLPYK